MYNDIWKTSENLKAFWKYGLKDII